MKNFKRILAIALALILCVSVVGCKETPAAGSESSALDSGSIDTSASSTESIASSQEENTSNVSSEAPSSQNNSSVNSGDILKPNTNSSNSTSNNSSSSKNQGTTSVRDPLANKEHEYLDKEGTKQEKMFGNLQGTKLRVPGNAVPTEWENTFVKQFEKKYGVDVEVVPMTFAEQQTKLPSIIASKDKKNYLDVCTISNTTFLRYIYGNIIQDFTKYVDTADKDWKYFGTNTPAYNSYTLNNKIYGSVPIEIHETYIFYNKTYFKEKNIKDPYEQYYLKNNWTFDTFAQVAKQAVSYAADNKTIETYGWATWNYFAFAQAAGNSVIKTDGKKWAINLTDANGMAALNLLYRCTQDNSVAPFSGTNEFLKRKTAMIIERPNYAVGATNAYDKMSDEIGMVPMPKVDKNSDYYYPVTADGKAIPNCAQNIPGAVAWIYEFNKAVKERNSLEIETYRKNFISEEHEKIRNEYIKKAKPCYTWVDGLSGWYNGKNNRSAFLDIILKEKANPAVALDRMLPLLKESLRATVG